MRHPAPAVISRTWPILPRITPAVSILAGSIVVVVFAFGAPRAQAQLEAESPPGDAPTESTAAGEATQDGPEQVEADLPVAPAPPPVGPVPPPPLAPPPTRSEPDVIVTTMAEPDDEVVGEGLRLMLSVQTNAVVGELLEDGSGFAFERATLTGVPDALVGLRIGRVTAGVGLSWTQVNTPRVMMNPCTGAMEEFDRRRTLLGLIPTVRFDAVKTADGRARFDAGIALPVLLSSRTDERATFMCPGSGRDSVDATDAVYGFDLMIGGRYHIFPALSLGLDIGLSYLVFDADDDPDTPFDEPSVTTLTAYSALVLTIELPL